MLFLTELISDSFWLLKIPFFLPKPKIYYLFSEFTELRCQEQDIQSQLLFQPLNTFFQ